MTQRIELFLSMTQRIEFFSKKIRLTEFNLFSSNMTKELAFFLEYDEKNWTLYFLNMTHRIKPFFKPVSNWTFFFNMTQRIELILLIWLKELNSLFLIKLEVLNSLFWKRLKELNTFVNMTQRIVFSKKKKNESKIFFFFKTTQRIELFLKNKTWLKEVKF